MKFKEGCFYEKTIKLIGIVLAMILAIMQFSTISYGTSIDQGAMGGPSIGIDNTPPNIVSVSLDKNMVKPGETININMEVEDDMSGPKSFYIQWILKDIGNSTSDDRYITVMYIINNLKI